METIMIDYGTFEKKTYGNQNNFLKLFLVRSRCLALPQWKSIQQTLGLDRNYFHWAENKKGIVEQIYCFYHHTLSLSPM